MISLMLRKEPGIARLQGFGESIFDAISTQARELGAINLGQGAPDSDGPAPMLARAQKEIAQGNNQYAPAKGVADLRAAVAAHQQRYGLTVDPETEIQITVGATEGMTAAIMGLVEPGSEVIIIEPYFDIYPAIIALAGATPVAVPVRETPAEAGEERGSWDLDVAAIRQAVTNKTAMIVLNTPHNPTGAVFSRAALEELAEVVKEHQLLVVSDEVYELLTFAGKEHVPFATIPGMWEHTVTVSSAAKSFNATGWKTGWAVGPAALIREVRRIKQILTFAGATPLQPAVAQALTEEIPWAETMARGMEAKKDRLSAALRECGLRPFASYGTYFVVAEIPAEFSDDQEFCQHLMKHAGVAGIPISAFADDKQRWSRFIRFGFCKTDDTLDEAIRRLREWAGQQQK